MATLDTLNAPFVQTAAQPLALIAALVDEFQSHAINYCLWKGTFNLRQVAQGQKDIDILVSRADELRLIEIAARLGFKAARTCQQDAPPGVLDFFGHDSASGTIVHLHLHLTLIAGDRLTTNYLIPMAEPYLAAAVTGTLFRIASPEFEYILFVIRMTLDATDRSGSRSKGRRNEMRYLLGRVEEDKVATLLAEHFPSLSHGLFQKCSETLQGEPARFRLAKLRRQLQSELSVFARRSSFGNSLIRFQQRAARFLRARVLRKPLPKRRMLHGGTTIALIGGDGAGKSTAIAAMQKWLAADLDVKTVHLGRPPRSLQTRLIRGLLKIARGGDSVLRFLQLRKNNLADTTHALRFSEMLWQYCVARDRARTYRNARRFSNNGGILIFDRFPMPDVIAMDGPQIERMIGAGDMSGFWSWLARWEKQWYACMPPVDLTIVLRLQPEIAIERKPSEDPDFVRERGDAVWHADWSNSGAHVIDASRPMADVHHEIRNEIWSRI